MSATTIVAFFKVFVMKCSVRHMLFMFGVQHFVEVQCLFFTPINWKDSLPHRSWCCLRSTTTKTKKQNHDEGNAGAGHEGGSQQTIQRTVTADDIVEDIRRLTTEADLRISRRSTVTEDDAVLSRLDTN